MWVKYLACHTHINLALDVKALYTYPHSLYVPLFLAGILILSAVATFTATTNSSTAIIMTVMEKLGGPQQSYGCILAWVCFVICIVAAVLGFVVSFVKQLINTAAFNTHGERIA